MSITETLDRLLELQAVDSGIKALSDTLTLLPRQLEAAEEERAGVEGQVAEAQARLDEVLKRRRELEGEIETIGQNIITFENQKLKVKTNAEFGALNHQIEHEKKRRSGLEDEILLSFDDEETARERVKNVEAKLAEAARRTEARRQELEARSGEDETRLAELKERREGIVPLLDAALRRKYESLRSKKAGVAVTGVAGGNCGGCFSALPPQLVNEVKKRDRLHNCEFCGRFLVHEPE